MRLSVGIFALTVALSASSIVPPVHAENGGFEQTSVVVVPMMKCFNCTSTQVYNLARAQHPGYVYVYDLQHRTLFKYYVEPDTSCRPVSNESKSGDATSSCGSSNIASLMPNDSFVVSAFNQLLATYAIAPTIVLNPSARVRVDIEKFGHDIAHNDNRLFDPRDVAWENPQGSYQSFKEALTDAVSSPGAARDISPDLASALYDMNPYVGNFSMGAAASADDTTLTANIQFERSWGHADIDACNTNGDCVKYAVDVAPNRQVTVTYGGVWDANRHQYPSPQLSVPTGGGWSFEDGSSESHFTDYLRSRGARGNWTAPASPCSDLFLQCTWRGATLIDCNLSCL